jgi:hypothetical protein
MARLLVTETGTGRLLSIDLKTGATSIMTENLGFSPHLSRRHDPLGMMSCIAVSPSGTIFVTADEANVVYRIEPGQ